MNEQQQARQQALEILERDFGLSGRKIYLLDVIPLVEILWADGRCQEAERLLIAKYLREHVAWLREQADGMEVISPTDIDEFVAEFVDKRPPPELLETLAELARSRHAHSGSADANQRQRLIDYSLDIAAAAVTCYPYGLHDRFDEHEKDAFLKLARALI